MFILIVRNDVLGLLNLHSIADDIFAERQSGGRSDFRLAHGHSVQHFWGLHGSCGV